MSLKSAQLLKSPDSVLVATVLTLVMLFTLSGMLAPAPDVVPPPPEIPESYAEFQATESKLYSQFNEELIIRHFFKDKRGGVFLDVGCAFPKTNSTTCFLEAHRDWTGIGIDAVEDYGPLWEENRPNAKFFHYAVSDTSGESLTFYQAAYPIISSMYEDQVMKHADKPPVPVQVETITLDDLLDRENVARIDFMSLDIEGAEPLALAGFEIERFAPKLVCIEMHEGAENEQFVRDYFEDHDYERIEAYVPYDFANWYFRPKEAA